MEIDELCLVVRNLLVSEGQSERLSVIVMLLGDYIDKYNADLNQTLKLIKKGYKKYKDFLEESDN